MTKQLPKTLPDMTAFDSQEAMARLTLLANYMRGKKGADEASLRFYDSILCVGEEGANLICDKCPLGYKTCEYFSGYTDTNKGTVTQTESAPGLYGMTGLIATSHVFCRVCGARLNKKGECESCAAAAYVLTGKEAEEEPSDGPTNPPPPSGGDS